MNKNTFIALCTLPFMSAENAHETLANREEPVAPEHTTVAAPIHHTQAQIQKGLNQVLPSQQASPEVREKMQLIKNKNNTPDGFRKTAEIVQKAMKRKGLTFELSEDDEGALLVMNPDDKHRYELSLPEKEKIDPTKSYNMLFTEWEWTGETWECTDQELITTQTVQVLEDKVFELVGGENQNTTDGYEEALFRDGD